MSSVLQDLRYALRAFRRRPGFAATAIVTLALGLGANTAIFSVVNGVLLEPLPFPDADRLVTLWTSSPQDPDDTFNSSGANIRDWQERADFLDGLYAWAADNVIYTNRDGVRDAVTVGLLTFNAFDVLRMQPVMGRGLLPEDEGESAARVLVLSDNMWRRQFGGDPAAIGSTLDVNGEPHEVIGVMPPGFELPYLEDADAFMPFDVPITRGGRDQVWLGAVGRLRIGTNLASAQQEMDGLHSAIQREYPAETTDTAIRVIPLRLDLVHDVRPALFVLLGATGFLLLMACANVANLLLARAASRASELSLRQSLGASRGRIIRQLLTESALLTLGATLGGILMALVLRDALLAFAPEGLPRADHVRLNGTVFLFTVVAAFVTSIAFGLAPALITARNAPGSTLRGGGRGALGRRHDRSIRSALVVTQIAVAVVLMVGAGVLLRSFARLTGVDAGYNVDGVAVASVILPLERYGDADRRVAFFDQAIQRAAVLPGVQAAGATMFRPLSEAQINFDLLIDGRPRPAPGADPGADLGIATTGYFRSLDIGLVRGRWFEPTDTRSEERVALINQSMANEIFSGEDPVGKRVALLSGSDQAEPSWRRIVGVVEDIRQYRMDQAAVPMIYFDLLQQPQYRGDITVRTTGDARGMVTPLRQMLLDLEPLLPQPAVETMEVVRRESLAAPRFYALLLSAFATLAVILAAVGIYGMLAYTVSERTGEIGVRIAFGADRSRIVEMLLKEGLGLALIGIVVGLGGAMVGARWLRSLVFDVSPSDPLTMAAIGILFVAIAGLACYLPAARAARLNPLVALRGR